MFKFRLLLWLTDCQNSGGITVQIVCVHVLALRACGCVWVRRVLCTEERESGGCRLRVRVHYVRELPRRRALLQLAERPLPQRSGASRASAPRLPLLRTIPQRCSKSLVCWLCFWSKNSAQDINVDLQVAVQWGVKRRTPPAHTQLPIWLSQHYFKYL